MGYFPFDCVSRPTAPECAGLATPTPNGTPNGLDQKLWCKVDETCAGAKRSNTFDMVWDFVQPKAINGCRCKAQSSTFVGCVTSAKIQFIASKDSAGKCAMKSAQDTTGCCQVDPQQCPSAFNLGDNVYLE